MGKRKHWKEKTAIASRRRKGRKGIAIKQGVLYQKVDAFKRGLIEASHARHKGNVPAMSEELGVQRTYLYTLLQQYGLAAGKVA